MSVWFDSRDVRYKDPFGAVSCGAEVRFALGADEPLEACCLLVRQEFAGLEQEVPLSPSGDGWCGVLTAPVEPELIWYAFRVRRPDGSLLWLGRNGCGGEADRQRWQLTVYEPTPTPDWFGRGVTYQIFPDRFCRLAVPDGHGMVGQRLVHQRWDDTPQWQPDKAGEIRNNDYFGGSLLGIISKLDYLQSLSVSTLYLCPIFEADSNHRYNTADYRRIDPMLGTEEDFRQLCREAHRRGIRVLLDGVFNHTGSNSRYFNAEGFYPELGAAQSQDSPYFDWYSFHPWPTDYDAWWGVRTLPAVNEESPTYRDFIVRSQDSVVRHWLRQGADGWRLDVADELPDEFIAEIRQAMESEKPDSFLLGEVWEDGSNKIAYSHRRRYLLGRETHGLMNYPFRTAALAWLRGGDASPGHGGDPGELSACGLLQRVEYLGYPRHAPAVDHAGCGPDTGEQRRPGSVPPQPGGAGHGTGPAAAGCFAAVQLPRLPHGVLRRRGRDAGLRGSPEPWHLPVGAGGLVAAGVFPSAGYSAEAAVIPAVRRYRLSLRRRRWAGAAAAVRGRGDGGGHERRDAAAGAVHPVGGCAG